MIIHRKKKLREYKDKKESKMSGQKWEKKERLDSGMGQWDGNNTSSFSWEAWYLDY